MYQSGDCRHPHTGLIRDTGTVGFFNTVHDIDEYTIDNWRRPLVTHSSCIKLSHLKNLLIEDLC